MTNPLKTVSRARWNQIRRACLALLAVFILAFNGIAYLHAWAITHYAPVDSRTTRLREINTWTDKARLIILGPTVRRMANKLTPGQFQLPYRPVDFPGAGGARLQAWVIPGQPGRPTVLMFPGYGGSKDTLLRAAREFHAEGCETWLVDFAGVGDSEGNTTTIGWREAEDVAATVLAARERRTGPLVLYGTSMGATAILCASHRGLVAPDAVILECPFDRLTNTLGNRLRLLNIPPFPLAQTIAFWEGVQHRFNGLAHNPVEYARTVRCPVLLMQGENDLSVGPASPHRMAAAFGDRARIKLLTGAGHANLVRDAEAAWRSEVRQFLAQKVAPKNLTSDLRPLTYSTDAN